MADVTLPQQDLPQQQVLPQEAVSAAGLPQQHQRQQLLQQASVSFAGLPQPQQKQQVLQQVTVRAAGLPQHATAVERQVHAAKLAVALDEAARWQRLRSAGFMGPPAKRQKIYKYAGRAPQPRPAGQHSLALALPRATPIAAPQKLQANLVKRSNAIPSQHQKHQEDEAPQKRRKGEPAGRELPPGWQSSTACSSMQAGISQAERHMKCSAHTPHKGRSPKRVVLSCREAGTHSEGVDAQHDSVWPGRAPAVDQAHPCLHLGGQVGGPAYISCLCPPLPRQSQCIGFVCGMSSWTVDPEFAFTSAYKWAAPMYGMSRLLLSASFTVHLH